MSSDHDESHSSMHKPAENSEEEQEGEEEEEGEDEKEEEEEEGEDDEEGTTRPTTYMKQNKGKELLFRQSHLGLGGAEGVGGGRSREALGFGGMAGGVVGVELGYRDGVKLGELPLVKSHGSDAGYHAQIWDDIVFRGRRDEAMVALAGI